LLTRLGGTQTLSRTVLAQLQTQLQLQLGGRATIHVQQRLSVLVLLKECQCH